MESRGSGATGVEHHLLQAETPRKNGHVGRTLRWFTTVALNAAFLGMGVSAAVLGPTFPDLARNVNRNISSLSEIFVGRALGYMCGSVVGGVLFDCMNHFLLLGAQKVDGNRRLHFYLLPRISVEPRMPYRNPRSGWESLLFLLNK
uniref:sodium-dependent glucose transporter 1-like n=1 Tax=Arvicanthis niloticus TaxID=61156 RepID=UPI0014868969|nr:sodium-dependent glucose transporter 1-like [Arvicanthis niloticus]